MSTNNATKTMDSSLTGVLIEYKPQRADDVLPCPRCSDQSGHPAVRCPLRPLPTAVGHSTTVTTRPSSGGTRTSVVTTQAGSRGTTISMTVNIFGGHNHIWHYSGGVSTFSIETPTVASATQTHPNCKRRRRTRRKKSAKRARVAAEQTNSEDPTHPTAKTKDTDEDIIQ